MKPIQNYKWLRQVSLINHREKDFMRKPWSSGVILMSCVIVAMLLANLDLTKHLYHSILETELSIHISSPINPLTGLRDIDFMFPRAMNVERFINDILMVVFFFTVGLEIKREISCGELSNPKRAMMPVIAAMGGMIVPAVIYASINAGTFASSGWGIPTATDIAFAMGIMSIFGKKIPLSLKVFLTALAIADDLGAILVVALFYGESVNIMLLSLSLIVLAYILILKRLGEKRMMSYFIPAILLWTLFYYSGVHATMSGVVMAFLIPMKPRYNYAKLMRKQKLYSRSIAEYEDCESERLPFPNTSQRHCLRKISHVCDNSIGMNYRLEHSLEYWVNYVIMPIFALANAGVEIPDLSYFNIFQYGDTIGSVGMGVFFGLLIGKPLGITVASYVAIKLKAGAMPNGATWPMLIAVACLGGIGFTMSIFVDTLSFSELSPELTAQLRASGKIAVLLGSLCSGLLGSMLIIILNKLKEKQEE